MTLQADVVVIGGGPGGSSVAGCLARRGRSVIVLEKERFPRFHIGESLLPRSLEVFAHLGVLDELEQTFLRKPGARFLCSATRRTNQYLFRDAFGGGFPYAFQVPRADFDHVLLKHAARLGADVREQTEVTEIVRDDRGRPVGVVGKDASGARFEVSARFLVDATGRDTLLTSGRPEAKSLLPRLDQSAFFTHYQGAFRQHGELEGNIQIIVFEHGWFWLIPFRGDVASFGAVCNRSWVKTKRQDETLESFFDRTVAESCWATEMLSGATRVRPVGALADFSYRVTDMRGDGWLKVGDASGFIDPLFSTGAHLAIKGGYEAAVAIDDALRANDVSSARFDTYEKRVRYAAELFLGAVQAFYRGELRELLFLEPQRPTLRRTITSMLAGDTFHDKPPTWARFLKERFPPELRAS
ncbi:MAG: tryptophan 7-halogenase [Deltaproteobacteria bacterium]|nr:tryptophan 7-halogenase [Deltaproteobacteria bacterium]